MTDMADIRSIGFLRALFRGWTWRMAWRDSRASRRRLLVFSLSIVFGVAALVAVGSFGSNLRSAVDQQSKTLLGADLRVDARDPFSREDLEFLRGFGDDTAQMVLFSSMIYFTRTDETRLVQVRAIEDGYPYYGVFETYPAEAAETFRQEPGALVEEALLNQFDAKPGDEIRLGNLKIRVAGALRRVPGEAVAFATLAPRVYVPFSVLEEMGLLGESSLARYRMYYRFDGSTGTRVAEVELGQTLGQKRWRTTTVEERQRDLGRSMGNLQRYLGLVGFVALLLGGVGIASAIQVHIRQKLNSIGVLRCLGASSGQTFAVYLVQSLALGVFGVVCGSALGLLIQQTLPWVVGDFVPFPVEFRVDYAAVAGAAAVGLGICLLFALMPLAAVRLVAPLRVLRISADSDRPLRDPFRWLLWFLTAGGVAAFSIAQSRRWEDGLAIAAGLAGAFLILWLVALGLVAIVRRVIPARWPYVVRQGMANLYRPHNRTVLMTLAMGLGTFLILTLYLVQHSLIAGLIPQGKGNRANCVLFDIQTDQLSGVEAILEKHQVPILESAPVVSMRLSAVNGISVESLLSSPDRRIARWTLRREYRSTFRSTLSDTETLIVGSWIDRVESDAEIVPISLEEGIAKELEVSLGDRLVFDVQGIPIITRIASLREVDWRRVQSNFFVVFPLGVLEEAPGFFIVTTHTPSAAVSAKLQRDIVKAYPNVSAIDLSLILRTLDEIFDKIAFVIRFMLGTGLFVLFGATLSGRYQRLRESVLLRTLGASRRQIRLILIVEYLCLGLLSGLAGVMLALAAGWGLSRLLFEIDFQPPLLPNLIAPMVLCVLTVLTGVATSWGIARHSPLEILRNEL